MRTTEPTFAPTDETVGTEKISFGWVLLLAAALWLVIGIGIGIGIGIAT